MFNKRLPRIVKQKTTDKKRYDIIQNEYNCGRRFNCPPRNQKTDKKQKIGYTNINLK